MVTVRRNEILITEDEENEKDDDAEVQINMKTEESQEAVDCDQEDYTEQQPAALLGSLIQSDS